MSEQTNGTSALALVPRQQPEALDWDTEETRKLIREMYGGKGIPEQDWQVFLAHARAVGLSPLTRQLCVIKFGDRWLPYTTIHGLVHNACKAKNYAGADQVEFDVKPTGNALGSQHPNWARATVYKMVQGMRVAFTAEVYWVERNKGQSSWKTQPWSMLGKCALAAAYRLGWSENSDLYIEEELGIENGRVVEGAVIAEQRQPSAPAKEPDFLPPGGKTWADWCKDMAHELGTYDGPEAYLSALQTIVGRVSTKAQPYTPLEWSKFARYLQTKLWEMSEEISRETAAAAEEVEAEAKTVEAD